MLGDTMKQLVQKKLADDLKSIKIRLDIDKLVYSSTDTEFIESLGVDIDKLAKLQIDSKEDFIKLQICNTASVYWVLCNAIRFQLSMPNIINKKYEPKADFFKKLLKSNVQDFLFDFTDSRMLCRISKSNDTTYIDGKFRDSYILTINFFSDDSKSLYTTLSYYIFPDLFPKIYLLLDKVENNITSNACKKCKICRVAEDNFIYKSMDNKTISRATNGYLIYIGKNLRYTLSSNCMLGQLKRKDNSKLFDYELIDIVNACIYAIELYLNRKSVIRKYNSNEKIPIAVDTTIRIRDNIASGNKSNFVTLKEYVSIERKHKGSKHSHHTPPREHIRKPYLRHLKSGKVVEVKGCTVNRGKGQTIYNVK